MLAIKTWSTVCMYIQVFTPVYMKTNSQASFGFLISNLIKVHRRIVSICPVYAMWVNKNHINKLTKWNSACWNVYLLVYHGQESSNTLWFHWTEKTWHNKEFLGPIFPSSILKDLVAAFFLELCQQSHWLTRTKRREY